MLKLVYRRYVFVELETDSMGKFFFYTNSYSKVPCKQKSPAGHVLNALLVPLDVR